MKTSGYRKTLPVLVLCFILAVSGGCQSAGRSSFDHFLDACLKNFGQENYLLARSYFSDPSSHGIAREDSSPFKGYRQAAIQERISKTQDMLTKLNTYDSSKLSVPQQEVLLILKDKLQLNKERGIKYPYYDSTLGEDCQAISLVSSLVQYEFHSSRDVEEYLGLLGEVPAYLEDLLDYEKARNKAGILTSMILVQDTCQALSSFLAAEEDSNILITGFSDRLEEIPDLGESEKSDYLAQNEDLI
ncbi:MAG: DUF885 family protein, partial [Eubacterium sp.]|nr:DUF885 family protein [Eubacterium sp.]